jgi:selenide, water dikinase
VSTPRKYAMIMIDLVRLARFAGARLILDRVTGIDRDQRQLFLQNRAPIPYDLLSLDIGITSDLPQVAGFAAHGFAAKPLGDYAQKWAEFMARDMDQPNLVLIGAGLAAWNWRWPRHIGCGPSSPRLP